MHKILKQILFVCLGLLISITSSFADGTRILKFGKHLDFGTVSVGNSVTRELTLYNKGDSELTISNLHFHQNIMDLFTGNWSGTIPANGEQNVTITFTPISNTPVSGLVYVESDRTNSGDRSRSLTGLGEDESSKNTRILRLGKHLDFGDVAIGSSSVKQLTVYNDGNSVLNISKIRFHQKLNDVYTAPWTGSIPAHGSKLIDITFKPIDKKNYNGLVYIESDKTNNVNRSRLLRGVGIENSENHRPSIHLNGNPIVTLSKGSSYVDAGAVANDFEDGNLTLNIQTISTVDTSVEGNYTVTYSVSDSVGNMADVITRRVNIVALGGKLQGKVVDLSGNPISGAIVNVDTKERITDGNGSFYFDDLAVSDRSVLVASHQDYLTNSRIVTINSSVIGRLNIVLSKASIGRSFNSNAGVTIPESNGGASIVLPPNIYVDREGNRYDGDINLSLNYYPITTPNGQDLFPGNFDAINQNNERGALQSYGFVLISLEDSNGNSLDINGRATISLPADTSLGTPLATLPLWYYDEDRGIWVEDGEATYNTSTGRYEGEITRIATYNLDIFSNPANLKVCVEDTNGTKVTNAYIHLSNGNMTWSANVGPTSEDGYMNILRVLGETDLNVSAYTFDGRYGEYNNNPINLTSGQDNELDSCIVIDERNISTDINLTKGLVAYYKFEGNAKDSSGNGNDGTEHGGVTYVDGVIGQAGSFDGIDDYILIANNDSLNITKAITMSAWVYIENYDDGWASILTKGDTSSMNSPYALLVQNRKLQIALNRNLLNLEETNVPDKKWTHITITWDGSIVRYFINGIEESETRNFNNSLNVIDGNLVIGKDAPGATEWFSGKIDDLRLYNRALTEAEIKELYKQQS